MQIKKSTLIALLLTVGLYSCDSSDGPAETNSQSGGNTISPNGITVLNDCNPCELDLYTEHLLNEWGIAGFNFTVYKQGVFAYWWDSSFDISSEIPAFANVVDEVATDLANYGVGNPLAYGAGQYANIYIHRGDDDVFPAVFSNGTGFEGDEINNGIAFAYLAYPYSEDLTADKVNIYHELFHVFQGPYTYKGIVLQDAELMPNATWAVEGFAEWYQMSRLANSEIRAFENVHSIYAAPDISLWSFRPRQTVDQNTLTDEQLGAIEWVFGIRQYAHGAFLHFLTNVKGVSSQLILDAWFSSTQTGPQESLYQSIGGETLRSYYAEWAARNVSDFDYLTTEQVVLARNTYNLYAADLPDGQEKPYVIELQDTNANGDYSPEALYRPKAWGYNVIKISNSAIADYTFSLTGNATGSLGSDAHFEAYIAVKNAGGAYSYQAVNMVGATSGPNCWFEMMSSTTQ